MWIFAAFLALFLVQFTEGAAKKCGSDVDCSRHWPDANCVRGRCRCPENTLRRVSKSREWVCLAVNDAATGQVGPPLTCPLPHGAGYNTILRKEGQVRLCTSKEKKGTQCAEGYECIQGIGLFGPNDGACCPDRETTCGHPVFDHEDGHLTRWAFDGGKCTEFKWNPEKVSSANNFATKEHCEDYCLTNGNDKV